MIDELDQLKYPIGKFAVPQSITDSMLEGWIDQIRTFPRRLREELAGLNESSLDSVYRPGGWSIRQVVHHLPDSHMNAYIRFKLALTEDQPVIRPYHEDRWAELAEAKSAPVDVSLNLVESLHVRWVLVLQSLTVEDLDKVYIHPEHGKTFKLKEVIGMYAWHSDHHLAHIRTAKLK